MSLFGRLFGFEIDSKQKTKNDNLLSPVPKQTEDGATSINTGGVYYLPSNFDTSFKDENEAIKKYREVALIPEAEDAIDDITEEAVVIDDLKSIDLNLDKIVNFGPETKKAILREFQHILRLLDWNNKGHDVFRSWYVDGRLFYHKVIDTEKPNLGIQELRRIDPLQIKKVNEYVTRMDADTGAEITELDGEHYLFDRNGITTADINSSQGLKLTKDSVAFAHSGIFNTQKSMVISYLHKAIKPLNQLRMVEDATVIYRLTRATEKRAFYIDVGDMPTAKAEGYVAQLMNKFKNQLTYDSNTGEIRDVNHQMAITEDYWLPRREGGKGTEIATLAGGTNLGEMQDVEYFRQKFLSALKLPSSRFEKDAGFSIGRSSEITRDELKFSKFVKRLRNQFSTLFDDLLKTQLVLKQVITDEEWTTVKEHIFYEWNEDSYFSEFKENEMFRERLNLAEQAETFIDKYYSRNYVRKNILKMSDEQVQEMDNQIAREVPIANEEQADADAESNADDIDQDTMTSEDDFNDEESNPLDTAMENEDDNEDPEE